MKMKSFSHGTQFSIESCMLIRVFGKSIRSMFTLQVLQVCKRDSAGLVTLRCSNFGLQYTWLEEDLASVNRSQTPWVIFSG